MTALLIGFLIGSVLGLTGAGGSVFAVPLLILLIGMPVNDAVGIALGAVSVSALYGTLKNWYSKSVLWIPAIVLGSCGAIAAPAGKFAGSQLPPNVLLLGFSALAIFIAVRMWWQTLDRPEYSSVIRSGALNQAAFLQPMCRMSTSGQFEWRPRCVGSLAIGGLAVGILAGLFGVGGGFLIVPLLLYLSQVSMQQAVGTSLFIISVVSAAGFMGFVAAAPHVDWPVLALIVAGGLGGMFVGHLCGGRIAGPTLQRVFSVSLIAVVTATLWQQFF